MNHGEDQGRNSLAHLNATRRVVFLPPLEEMPKKDDQQEYESGLWVITAIVAILALFSVAVIASCNPIK